MKVTSRPDQYELSPHSEPAGLKLLELWDTFNNQLHGDPPESISTCHRLSHLFLQDENIELLADHFCGRDHFPYQTPRNRKTNQVELARNYREWIIGRRGPGVHAMQQLG